MKKLMIVANFLCVISFLVSCSSQSMYDVYIVKHSNNSDMLYWKSINVENGTTINLIPNYKDNMPYIDSVEYVWDERHIVTLREMPFCSSMNIEEDSIGLHILHNIVFYNDSRKVDYYINYHVK